MSSRSASRSIEPARVPPQQPAGQGDVLPRGQEGQQPAGLEHIADVGPAQPAQPVQVARAPRAASRSVAGAVLGAEAEGLGPVRAQSARASRSSRVLLPLPLAPRSTTTSPGRDAQLRHQELEAGPAARPALGQRPTQVDRRRGGHQGRLSRGMVVTDSPSGRAGARSIQRSVSSWTLR